MHFSPRRYVRFLTVFDFVPLTGRAKTQTAAVYEDVHSFADGQAFCQPTTAPLDGDVQFGKAVTQLVNALHRNRQTAHGPAIIHKTSDLPYSPLMQPIESIDQLDIHLLVRRLTAGNTFHLRRIVDELTLVIAVWKMPADHAPLFRDQVICIRICHTIARLPALALLALLDSYYYGIGLIAMLSNGHFSRHSHPPEQRPCRGHIDANDYNECTMKLSTLPFRTIYTWLKLKTWLAQQGYQLQQFLGY